MTLVTLDIVLLLPGPLREAAVSASSLLSRQMSEGGGGSYFQLGQPYPGTAGAVGQHACEPHVSLFMLAVDEDEVGQVTEAVQRIAGSLPAVQATGDYYRHNPFGAPELYCMKTPGWLELQRAVVSAAEPLRRGRLRERDPAGQRIRDITETAPAGDPSRSQLLRYGYDEITDSIHDRFNPHVTLAWPKDPASRVSLSALTPPHTFSGQLSRLGVFGMQAHGTCTVDYGTLDLAGAHPNGG